MSADAARQSSRSAHARRLYMQRHGLLPREEEEPVYSADPTPPSQPPPAVVRTPSRPTVQIPLDSDNASSTQTSTIALTPYVTPVARLSGSDNGGTGPRWSRGSSNDHQLHVYMQRHGLFKKPDESVDELTVDGNARTDEKYSSRYSSMRNIVGKEKYALDSASEVGKKGGKDKEKKETEPKVSFFALYRFHTKREIFINILGFIPAAATGAAQPLMSLIFGRLTQDFVDFANAVGQLSDPAAILRAAALLPRLAENFRKSSAINASYMVYLGLGTLIATTLFMTAWVYTAEMASKRLRERYLKAILRQDVAFFDTVGPGEVTTRITTDTHLVHLAVSEKVALSITYIAAFIAGFTLAFVRNWRLALAMSSVIPCIALTGGFLNHFIQRYLKLSLAHIAEGGTLAEEVLGSVRTAHAFGTQKTLSDLYNSFVEKSRKVDSISAVFNGCGMAVFFFVIYAAYALAFSFGATLINEGYADAGTVVNVFLSVLIGSFSLALLAPEAQAIAAGQAAAAKLYATIDRVPTIDSQSKDGDKPYSVKGALEIKNVSFKYPSRPEVPILTDLSLSFPAGKTIALVGASGSGKSTIISLVERFYDPDSGSVTLDGNDLKDLNVRWLRSQIGLVSQEPVLFATTIRDNVAHGLINTVHEHASETKKMSLIINACKKANAHSFIKKLPLGYNTLVGERGFLMSGGQKQRIAIARAIVSDPRILLLDEATSALDTQSEGVVQDALDKAAAGRTTICVAHRLSTIKDADCIYVMGEGKVLQSGTHSELLQDIEGAYARLVNSQKLRESDEPVILSPVSPNKSEEDFMSPLKSAFDDEKDDHRLSIVSYEPAPAAPLVTYSDGPEHSLSVVLGRMLKINKEDWVRYVLGLFFASLTGCIYPGFGIVFAKGIDAFSALTPDQLHHDADRSALYLFIIAVASILTTGVQTFMLNSAAANLGAKIRLLSFRALLRQDIAYFDREDHATGSLTSSLSDNAQKISGMAGLTLGVVIQSIATVVSGLIIGLIFAWKLALVAISTMPLLLSSGYTRLRIVILKDQSNKKEHEASAQVACEAAGAIRTVASLTREEDCLRVYSQSLELPLRRSNRMAIWSNLLFASSQCMAFFVIALVFWYGSRLVSFQEYTVFQFFAGIMATVFGATQAGGAFAFSPDISSARSAGSNVINLLDSVPEIDTEGDKGKSVPLKKVEGTIIFKDVEFEYPTRKDAKVLKGLSLSVQPGTYVALVGASGCGKSTCIQLIERFYNPEKGSVHLDGYDIKTLNLQEYRKCLALVSQEPTLYAGTIRFNILLGAIKPPEEVTEEELTEVCRKANILDFIKSLPDGFETQVGGKGSQLSGGQKQRIAIARALIRNPKVLLLDEATSALDSNSEKVVQVALDQARLGRTTIAIAHRLSTIQNADCIYFLKEGKICESGTHEELLRLRGEYYEYVQLQALSGK